MILCFPNLDTFRLVVTSTLLPADVMLAPASVHVSTDGRIFLETPAKLAKKATSELTKLGVAGAKALPEPVQELSCWLQALPLVKDPAPLQLASQAPVLFELPSATDLPQLVGEMLRLGNDRQGFRFLGDGKNAHRVLLRVIGPPYYSLLRAMDQLTEASGQPVRAYTETAPRVWVQVGFKHPAANGLKPAEGQLLLLRSPLEWEYLADAPFQDVYDILQFKLPTATMDWVPAKTTDTLEVKLKLALGNAADAPELWVLKDDAVAQLDEFVRDADERLINRLRFAVADVPGGEKVVVLRVSPAKLAPPALQFRSAVGFKPFYKLPNLYLPVGTRLHPQLRRDAVRRLLADDTDLLVWLYPGPAGAFAPETLSENAFRPLEDWVEYVIETEQNELKAWIDASRFHFESFICADGQSPKPKPPTDKPEGKGKGKGDDSPTPTPSNRGRRRGLEADPALTVVTLPTSGPPKPPNEWKIRRDQLEKEFLEIDGPLDAPERVALWAQLAEANIGYGSLEEAAICWANAAWASEDAAVLAAWGESENGGALTAPALDAHLKKADPNRPDVRQALAGVLTVLAKPQLPEWFGKRLPDVQRYFEAHENKLSVRSVWLLAVALAGANSGADVLGLARVRDRLLQRLFETGLNPEMDMPLFLRTAGLQDSERVRQVRDKLPELHKAAREWVTSTPRNSGTAPDIRPTLPYVDLLFSFGYARLGSSTEAREALQDARTALLAPHADADEAACRALLFRGFSHRIELALANKPHTGPLPAQLRTEMQTFQDNYQKAQKKTGVGHYPLTRLRSDSQLFDPAEGHEVYLEFQRVDPLRKAIYELNAERNPDTIRDRIRLLHQGNVGTGSRAAQQIVILHGTILLAGRVGEAFADEQLALVPQALLKSPNDVPDLPRVEGKLLERALLVAAHFDRREMVQQLVSAFVTAVQGKSDENKFEVINYVAGQCLRSLRRFGLNDEIDRLLKQLTGHILGTGTLTQLRGRYASDSRGVLWFRALRSLVALAGGWLSLTLASQAVPLLDEARNEILKPMPQAGALVLEFAALVADYLAVVGSWGGEEGLNRVLEVFRKIDPGRVTNTQSTSKSYSRLHLKIVEAMLLSVASDDFSLGADGRRWLTDDEYLVRKRIHADLRQYLNAGGL